MLKVLVDLSSNTLAWVKLARKTHKDTINFFVNGMYNP
jgi:hypothetical protein